MACKPSSLVICCAAFAASSGVQAVGFGRVSPTAVLGQPLNMAVPLVLDPGERLTAECVHAEVTAGDAQLPPQQVRVAVQPGGQPGEWTARVQTTVAIQEPVLEVSVSAGCERRFMRRFTAFADPPLAAPLSAPAMLSPAQGRAEPSPVRVDEPVLRPVRPAPSAAEPAARPRRATVAKRAPAESKPSQRVLQAAAKAVPREDQVARLLLDVGTGPRLRMDMEEPVFMPAAAAASAALDVGASDIDRLQLLEKTLGELKKETQTYRNNEAGLKARLAEAESRSRLVPWLVGLSLLAVAAAAMLALRGRRRPVPAADAAHLDEAPADQWWKAGGAAGTGAAPAGEGAGKDPGDSIVSGAMLLSEAHELPADSFPVSPYERTQPFTPGEASGTGLGVGAAVGLSSITDGQIPAREVSVEELLDLEQQADFFIALGQEDAAVDLLMSHLRGTGGQSPLPYTKLLEIYRRQGDRAAYERIRARFNRRFNAYAPDWEQGPLHGRSLEDYPEVVQRLQSMWSSPLNSMAVLEAMLFRNDEAHELFDLPAYKDVLLLYSLARDLYQQQGVSAEDVDLLLPLGDDELFASSAAVVSPAADGAGVVDDVDARVQSYDLTAFSLDTPSPELGLSIEQLRGEPGKSR